MHKTRGKWRTENSNCVVLSMEMLSASIGDEGAVRETLASTIQNTGLFCFGFLPDDVLEKKN